MALVGGTTLPLYVIVEAVVFTTHTTEKRPCYGASNTTPLKFSYTSLTHSHDFKNETSNFITAILYKFLHA